MVQETGFFVVFSMFMDFENISSRKIEFSRADVGRHFFRKVDVTIEKKWEKHEKDINNTARIAILFAANACAHAIFTCFRNGNWRLRNVRETCEGVQLKIAEHARIA